MMLSDGLPPRPDNNCTPIKSLSDFLGDERRVNEALKGSFDNRLYAYIQIDIMGTEATWKQAIDAHNSGNRTALEQDGVKAKYIGPNPQSLQVVARGPFRIARIDPESGKIESVLKPDGAGGFLECYTPGSEGKAIIKLNPNQLMIVALHEDLLNLITSIEKELAATKMRPAYERPSDVTDYLSIAKKFLGIELLVNPEIPKDLRLAIVDLIEKPSLANARRALIHTAEYCDRNK